ncbi:hypothetical protein Peur_001295 [Populus x canadensis]
MQDADDEREMGVVSEFGVINGYKSNMVFKCEALQIDGYGWHSTSFTVKSAYQVALNLQQAHEPGTSNSGERTRKIWKRVWLLSITPKIRHFLLKCLHNSLATRENLFRRSIVDSPACFRCGAPMEYSLHILRDCTLSRSARSILRPSLLAASTHNTDVMQWLVDSILSEDDNVAEFGNMITWA